MFECLAVKTKPASTEDLQEGGVMDYYSDDEDPKGWFPEVRARSTTSSTRRSWGDSSSQGEIAMDEIIE